jgi:ABC-type multidrug transport system permease subunit
MIRRILAVLHARNVEFLRDRATLGWNVLVPIALVGALALIFSGPERPLFKVGVLHNGTSIETSMHPFLATHYIEFFTPTDEADAIRKVGRHEIDLLLDLRSGARYWVNTDSPKGYVAEKLLLQTDPNLKREPVSGQAVRYVDWLLPGVLGMNMMFSCLFGVGWVVVRYRKSGFLKRLQATPLRAIEFISAQVLSRLILIMVVMVLVFASLRLVLHFRMEGSYLLLLLVALFGAIALIAIGLFIAARFTSEELASGIINAITWPMMLLSGVWFSLEGSARWLQWLAKIFPLTQMLDAGRAIMLDGAGLAQITPQLIYLAITAVLFLALGALSFKWQPN